MKKLILSVTAIAGLTMAANAQQVQFADGGSGNGSIDTQIAGVNNLSDLNLELLVGSGGTAGVNVVTLLLSQATSTATSALGTIQSAKGDISGSGGDIADQTVNFYQVAGGTTDYQVLAWTGNYSSYAAALASGVTGVFAGESSVQVFAVAPAAGSPAVKINLDANGPINLTQVPTTIVPEPGTLAMAGVGLASMLIFRRRK